MSLTRNEVVQLLALIAVLDDRDTDDPLTISAWHAMAEQGQWESFAAARRALLVYRSEHPDYPIRPGHITQVLQRVRTEASRRFNAENSNPPDHVLRDDNPDAYRQWAIASAEANRLRVFDEFAEGHRPTLAAIEAAP